jgi:hypothetical protein
MQRRKFLKKTLVGGAIIATGGAYFWLKSGDGVEHLTIENALMLIDSHTDKSLISIGNWNSSEIFNHLAQSIEYSMVGYPLHKSNFFKNTAGKAAISVFVTRGQMIHSLTEGIPGAPDLEKYDSVSALQRLRQSLIDFKAFDGELMPHFAYGKLTKKEYTYAHIMHINNHFQELKLDD